MLLKTVGLYVNLLLIRFLTDCIGKYTVCRVVKVHWKLIYLFFSLTWNTCKMTQHYFIKRSIWLSYIFLQTARCKANFTRQNGGQIVFLIHFSFLFTSVKSLCIQQNKTPLLLIVNIACYCKSEYSHLWPSTEFAFSMVKQYAWVQY